MQHSSGGGLDGPVELDGTLLTLPGPHRRSHPTMLYALLAAAGLLALLLVTAGSGMTCAGSTCSSGPWWAGVVASTGVAAAGLTGWARRPPVDRPAGRSTPSALVEALIGAAVVYVMVPVLAPPQLHLMYRSGVTFAAAILLAGLVAWWVAAALHAWMADGQRRHEVIVGLVAGLAAATAWGHVSFTGSRVLEVLPGNQLLWAVALAATVIAVRAGQAQRLLPAAVAAGASGLALLIAGAAANYLVGDSLRPAPVPDVAGDVPQATPATPGPALSTAAPSEAPDDVVPAAGDLCSAYTLVSTLGTPVPGGHDVATTLTVTNWGEQPCTIEGWPSLRLLSDGEDLALFVHVAEVDPSTGTHVEAEPITLEPKEAAKTQIWWPAHGAAADWEAAQELHVGIGGTEVKIPLAQQQKWDVVRSAEAWVAPWQPAGTDPAPEGDG